MKIFDKHLWLISANADKENGILTQTEIDDACEIWVNNCDGKSEQELEAQQLNPEWFKEV